MDALWLTFSLIMGLSMIFFGYVLSKMANAGHGITGTSEQMKILRSEERSKQTPMGSGWHDTYGWQRRSDLDEAYDGFMYETPDGHLVRSVDPRHKEGMYLDKYVVEDTGETVYEISKIPRVFSKTRKKITEL